MSCLEVTAAGCVVFQGKLLSLVFLSFLRLRICVGKL